MNPKTEILPCGHKIIPFIYNGKLNMELTHREQTLCQAALIKMDSERIGHRLEENYSYKSIQLGKMFLYNFVFYKNTIEPMFCSGSQIDGNAIRVFSRYFSFKKYRTDGKNLLDKVDNFDELKYSLKHLDNKLVYWSRDKSSNFFDKLKKGRADIFANWEVHPDKINIMRTAETITDNYQSIFYTGDINEILHKRN